MDISEKIMTVVMIKPRLRIEFRDRHFLPQKMKSRSKAKMSQTPTKPHSLGSSLTPATST